MFEGLFQPMHLLVVFVIALFVFGVGRDARFVAGAIARRLSTATARNMARPAAARLPEPRTAS